MQYGGDMGDRTPDLLHEKLGHHVLRQVTKFQSCRGDMCSFTDEKPQRKHFDENNSMLMSKEYYYYVTKTVLAIYIVIFCVYTSCEPLTTAW